MEHDESLTFARLRRLRDEVIQPKVVEHGGRLIKTTGDGFLAEFSSATAALKCGIDIQRNVVALEADRSVETRLRFRIGINVGDIIIDGGDVAGDGVNIAARLEPLAPPDGICISGYGPRADPRRSGRDVRGTSEKESSRTSNGRSTPSPLPSPTRSARLQDSAWPSLCQGLAVARRSPYCRSTT